MYLFVCSKNVLLANDVGDQCFAHVYGLVGILPPWAEASSGSIGFFKPRPGSWWSKAKRAGLESDLGGCWLGQLAVLWESGMSLSLRLIVQSKGIIIPLYRIVMGIKRKKRMCGAWHRGGAFILYFLSFGCLEKSPSCPLIDITHF